MSQSSLTPEERYQALVKVLREREGVTLGTPGKKGFGSSELKINEKIFAMLSGGRLVVKLPRARVDALVEAGLGQRFDPRRDGRLMKEWLTIEPAAEEQWLPLAQEALAFVGAKR
jgi:TfoX/Sxy family transcriptional regulator of competence genes